MKNLNDYLARGIFYAEESKTCHSPSYMFSLLAKPKYDKHFNHLTPAPDHPPSPLLHPQFLLFKCSTVNFAPG